MKKLVQINSICGCSTGNIMESIAEYADNNDYEVYNFYRNGKPSNKKYDICFENKLEFYIHIFLARIGLNGHGSYFSTKKLIKYLKKINPDIIQLHNIHGYYINLKLLFDYLKNDYTGKVFWTIHDCWALTGHCCYFSEINCQKWHNGCNNCPQLYRYPKEYIDTTNKEYILKKDNFTNVKKMTIITPSKWLEGVIKQSYLKEYNTKVINNGIDFNVFKNYPNNELKDTYLKYKIPNEKQILLGVAIGLDKNKGLYDHIEIANRLNDNQVLVLVGIDKKIMNTIKTNVKNLDRVIMLPRTNNQIELVKLYNIADYYLNLSIEETFGMTTIEAMAVGTPVIVYNKTAVPECVTNDSGIIIDNYDNRINLIMKVINSSYKFDKQKIINNAKQYSKEKQSEMYLELYNSKGEEYYEK